MCYGYWVRTVWKGCGVCLISRLILPLSPLLPSVIVYIFLGALRHMLIFGRLMTTRSNYSLLLAEFSTRFRVRSRGNSVSYSAAGTYVCYPRSSMPQSLISDLKCDETLIEYGDIGYIYNHRPPHPPHVSTHPHLLVPRLLAGVWRFDTQPGVQPTLQ